MASQFPILYSPSPSLRTIDPFLDLSREMNRLMDNFFSGATNLLGAGTRAVTDTIPRIDVQEDKQEVCISAELPGVSVNDVDVRLDGDVISICGTKNHASELSMDNYKVMERSYGSFRRAVPLPFKPDPHQINAEFNLGVLTIHVPKQAQTEVSQRIEVKDAAEAGNGSERTPDLFQNHQNERQVSPGNGVNRDADVPNMADVEMESEVAGAPFP